MRLPPHHRPSKDDMSASQSTAEIRRIHTPAAAADGASLYFETVATASGPAGAQRIRPDEDTLLRVIAGTLRLTIGNVEHLLGPGGEAIVRAGHAHRLVGVGGEARCVMGFRAAVRR
jgi:mannose-6-phosphate isomerase-like protein (cupin superfamily)